MAAEGTEKRVRRVTVSSAVSIDSLPDIEKAAAIEGKTLSAFIADIVEPEAKRIVENAQAA